MTYSAMYSRQRADFVAAVTADVQPLVDQAQEAADAAAASAAKNQEVDAWVPNFRVKTSDDFEVFNANLTNARLADLETGAAAQALRNGNGFVVFGDSRTVLYWDNADGFRRRKSARQWFNLANALMRGRMAVMGHYATSGAKLHEYLTDANVAAAIATNAKYAVIGGIINSVLAYDNTYDYFSGPSYSGGEAGVKAQCDALIAAGITPILTTERGATSATTSARLAAINIYNQKVRQYVREKAGQAILFDLARVFVDASAAPTAFKNTTAWVYDGLHDEVAGAIAAAQAFQDLIEPLIPAIEQGPHTQGDVFANGGAQALANPLFTTTTGGTGGTGISGSIPASWAVAQSSGTYTTAVASAAGDHGNDVTLTTTADAAGWVRFSQAIAAVEVAGENWEGFCEVEVVSHSNLGAPYLDMERAQDPGGGTTYTTGQDLFWDTTFAALPAGGIILPLWVEQFPVLAGTRSYWSFRIWLPFKAAGSAVVKIRAAAVRKKFTL